MIKRLLCALLLLAGATACRATKHPTFVWSGPVSAVSPQSWDEVFAKPVDVEVDVVVSADWEGPRKGLINLKHPAAKAAHLKNGPEPIVLPVGIIRHSTGDYLVDTGVDESIAKGKPVAVKGPLKRFLKKVEPRQSLAAIIKERNLNVQGALMTHLHVDHVLGLPDLPTDLPIYTGRHEVQDRRWYYGPLKRTYRLLFANRSPIREFDFEHGMAIAPFESVVDVLGDGSVWAIPSPGHTPGSVAYLVNAKSGPVLFVGDTSHTRWGWEHGVEPGTFTADHKQNAESLARLKEFVKQYPQIKVVLGHQL